MTTFSCRACGALLTPALREIALPVEPETGPWIDRGAFARDPEPFGPPYLTVSLCSKVVVHLEDVLVVRHVASRARMSGCCGPSGIDGPNRMCTCGAEIGTEQSDCWTPHVVRLETSAIVESP